MSHCMMANKIPINVFNGYLGSGKTSCILGESVGCLHRRRKELKNETLGILEQLPVGHKVAIIKNEFGDMQVDSALLDHRRNVTAMKEIQNGCLCCTLTGPMEDALEEIAEAYKPDRIIVETSGSAFPAPIAIQLRRLEREGRPFKLDSIVTVIDCIAFRGYEDVSHTAKLQAQYTDCIIMNKWELISERAYDDVLDHVLTLNPDTFLLKTRERTVDPSVIFNLATTLYSSEATSPPTSLVDHHDEIDLLHLYAQTSTLNREQLQSRLEELKSEDLIRIKGRLRRAEQVMILNWAFGRWDLTPLPPSDTHTSSMAFEVVVMLRQGCARLWRQRLVDAFGADDALTRLESH